MVNHFHDLSISMWQGLKTHHATLLPRFAVPAVVLYTSEGLPDQLKLQNICTELFS